MRRIMRETAFRLVRSDLVAFVDEHEEQLVEVFRQELFKLDEQMPEERLFIDIHMVPLGEELLRAALRALRRFLREA